MHHPDRKNITQAITTFTLALLCAGLLSSCSVFQGMFDKVTIGEEQEIVGDTPEALITQGMDAYSVGDYSTAIRAFEKILDEHPFSQQAMLAELKSADAHYYNHSYLEAKLLYQQFEERHPTNEAVPYVIFQIGMCDFQRTDRIDRDVTGAQDAIKSFSRLLRSFPDSPYTKEARARIAAAKNFLVNHEYFVAVFYVRTKEYEQAQHRLKYILAMYPNSTIAPKASALLKRLEENNPPRWGIQKWLPSLTMPQWISSGEAEDTDNPVSEKSRDL
ncbi:outer membrane protein assembly factor BamD [Desulfogranum japonicum]|uniref:outer membrane protein assembly factor BamD n=1 Tax=Desulfogranum japonicum TaxID=231447 RepID=UPI0004032330|nr:outer membrane protein assembly factor BamD [Desulfogranum japonicum]